MTGIHLETTCSIQAGIAGPATNLILEKESLNKKEIKG